MAVIGLVAIIYTSLGGLQAVVITDLAQTILLYGGAITVLIVVTINFGGFSWMPTEWPRPTRPFLIIDSEGELELSENTSWHGKHHLIGIGISASWLTLMLGKLPQLKEYYITQEKVIR